MVEDTVSDNNQVHRNKVMVHTNAGKLLTKKGDPIVCYECGKNHWRGDCAVQKSKQKKKKEEEESGVQTGSSNVTIGDDTDGWGDGVDYSGLMFLQHTTIMTEGEDEEVDYDHILEQSRGVVDSLWVLLDNQSTVNVFF